MGVFNFENPKVFWYLVVILPLVFALFVVSYSKDKKLLKRFYRKASKTKNVISSILVSVVFISLFAILAKPQEEIFGPPSISPKGDYVILVDTSNSSMAKSDIFTKSELDISKDIVDSLITSISARFQLFGYAGIAIHFTPLTQNIDYIRTVLDNNFYAGIVPAPGSDIGEAIYTIIQLKKDNPQYANVEYVILFSDGDLRTRNSVGDQASINKLVAALGEASAQNIKIITVGVGSASGWRIPILDNLGNFTGEYVKDRNGVEFVSFLNETNLRTIAEMTGGEYFYWEEAQDGSLERYIRSTLSDSFTYTPSQEVVDVKEYYYVYSWILVGSVFILVLFRKSLRI